MLIAFWASQAILSRHHILQISLSDNGVARSVVGGALYLTLFGVFCMATRRDRSQHGRWDRGIRRALLRYPAAAEHLPDQLANAINPWIPNSAARSIFQLTHSTHSLSPAGGLAVTLGYIAFAVGLAAILLVRRDT